MALKRRVKVAELRRLNPKLTPVGAAAILVQHLKPSDNLVLTVSKFGPAEETASKIVHVFYLLEVQSPNILLLLFSSCLKSFL